MLATKTKKSIWADLDKPFQLRPLKKTKKAIITDEIHGEAEVIFKEDLDGFTVYGFEGDELMAKNALYNIDVWKDELEYTIKSVRSELRVAIKNKLTEWGEPVEFEEIKDYVIEHHLDTFESAA